MAEMEDIESLELSLSLLSGMWDFRRRGGRSDVGEPSSSVFGVRVSFQGRAGG